MNIKYVLLFEKLSAMLFWIIPESLIVGMKKLIRRKKDRSKFLSSTSDYFLMRIKKGMNNLDMVYNSTEFELEKKVILELGTGGHGIDLILFYLLGARKIYTVDIKFFGLFNLPLAIKDTGKLLDLIISQFQLDKEITLKKFDLIKDETTVENILEIMNVEFLTFKEILKNKIKFSEKIDFFFSESNLQRIPLNQMDPLFNILAFNFNNNAVSFHRIDCMDINTQKSRPLYDPNLWKLEYLKYSDSKWESITTKRFGSQNRLRQYHFIEIFKGIGFEPIYIENYLTYKEDIDRIKRFNLNEKFKKIDPENVAITHFRFVATKNDKYINTTSKNFITSGAFPPSKPKWSIENGLIDD